MEYGIEIHRGGHHEQRVVIQDREEHPVCSHCLNTGYVYMTVETEDGEFEEVAYLCRKCEG